VRGRENWDGPFLSSVSPQGALGGVGSHCELEEGKGVWGGTLRGVGTHHDLRGGEGAGVESWEGSLFTLG
jgi:hypothetical protein